jgi:hypothetical protein
MESVELAKTLRRLGACREAREWAKGKSLAEVYEALHRADWWLWLAALVGVDRKRVVLAACACARTALKYVPDGETRPIAAIETAEKWARGEAGVTLNDVREAARASRAAYAAAAAYDAAAAAYAATYAAYAAYDAADDAAYAAYDAAAAADDDDARRKALAEMMTLVREHLPLEVVAALSGSAPQDAVR